MDVFEAAQYLINEELDVLVADRLVWFDYLTQVRLHQLRHHVDVVKVSEGVWLEDAFDRKNIRMVQQSHYFQLTECSQRKYFMFEGLINFFNGYEARLALSCVHFVFCSDNHSVCARANQLNNLVGVGDLETRA